MLGRRIETEESACRRPLAPAAPESEYSCADTTGSLRFTIALYVDEIAPTTPAAVVWEFKKGAHVKLSAREPLFKATRGFYGVLNSACTVARRPYYAINVAQFKGLARILDGAQQPVPTVQLAFRMFYDDGGVVRSRFDLTIVVTVDAWHNVTALGVMKLRLKGSQAVIGERNLAEGGTRSRSLPTLMFTPQIFQSITRPEMGWLVWPSHRKMCGQTWARLSELVATDWERYTIAKSRFQSEYSRNIARGEGWQKG